jgi:threonine synthase
LKAQIEARSVSDDETAQTMREVYEKHGYILDPHGAVGFHALEKYLEKNPQQKGFFLETAHPVKFDSVEKIVGTFGKVPGDVQYLLEREKQSVEIKASYENLKAILLGKI